MIQRDPRNPAWHRMVASARAMGLDGTVFGSATDADLWEQHLVDYLNGKRDRPDLDLAFVSRDSAVYWSSSPVLTLDESIYDGAGDGEQIMTDVWLTEDIYDDEGNDTGEEGLFDQTDGFTENNIGEGWADEIIDSIASGVPFEYLSSDQPAARRPHAPTADLSVHVRGHRRRAP